MEVGIDVRGKKIHTFAPLLLFAVLYEFSGPYFQPQNSGNGISCLVRGERSGTGFSKQFLEGDSSLREGFGPPWSLPILMAHD